MLLLLALLLPPSLAQAHVRHVERLMTPQTAKQGVEIMGQEALVLFKDGVDPAVGKQTFASTGMELVTPIGTSPWYLAYMPDGMPTATGLSLMRALPGVLAAEPNHVYRPLKVPNDPEVPSQWHLSNINAFAAWEYETGFSNPVWIAVTDAGIQGDHPDLTSQIVQGVNADCSSCSSLGCACVKATENPLPHAACNHGTEVAGVAAAATNNGVGIAGISWGAKLVSVKVFPDACCNSDCSSTCGPNTCAASDAAMIAAANYVQGLAGPGKRVVMNMSLGATGPCPNNPVLAADGSDGPMQQAFNAAVAANVVLVAAAGNQPYCTAGSDGVENPANCAGVIPVGATDSSNSVASFSCGGPTLANNGLVAPGESILTTTINNGYNGSASGTSFAAPMVAGAAALLLSAKPGMTPAQVQAALQGSTSFIGASSLRQPAGIVSMGNATGAGLLNSYSALRLAITGSTQFDGTVKATANPNPFRPAQGGFVMLTVPASVQGPNQSIKIYTMDGQLVRSLSGTNWDGKNDAGSPAATGSYVFLVKTDKGQATGRVALIR